MSRIGLIINCWLLFCLSLRTNSKHFIIDLESDEVLRTKQDPSDDYSSISSNTSNYQKLEEGKLCKHSNDRYESNTDIQTEAECKKAASELDLPWGKAWDGPGEHPACFYATDSGTGKKVFFNTSPNPTWHGSSIRLSLCSMKKLKQEEYQEEQQRQAKKEKELTEKMNKEFEERYYYPSSELEHEDRVATLEECGLTDEAFTLSVRIVGGKEAKLNKNPWIALLGYSNGEYNCGAALIGKKHVITAAHCLKDTGIGPPTTVRLGEHKMNDDKDGANPKEYKILKVIVHENYTTEPSIKNDIGLVKIEDVSYQKGIRPVCLPIADQSALSYPHTERSLIGEKPKVAGWGLTSYGGKKSNELLEGFVEVTTQKDCAKTFNKFDNAYINDTTLCAKDPNQKVDACQGDSGGPLVLEKPDKNNITRAFLIGIISSGNKCGTVGFPGIYSRVTQFMCWILYNISKKRQRGIDPFVPKNWRRHWHTPISDEKGVCFGTNNYVKGVDFA